MNFALQKAEQERFNKIDRLVDTCRDAFLDSSAERDSKIATVIDALQTTIADVDYKVYNRFLEVAIVCDSVACAEAIFKIPRSRYKIDYRLFEKVKSNEMMTLLLKHKRCDSISLERLIWSVIKGKIKMNQGILIESMVKECEQYTAPSPFQHIAMLFVGVVLLQSFDGLERMLKASAITRRWRYVARSFPTQQEETSNIVSIFRRMMRAAVVLGDKQMFEQLLSLIQPYKVFTLEIQSNTTIPMEFINPWVFVKHLGSNWYTIMEGFPMNYQMMMKMIVSSENRELTEEFLFRLAAVLYLHQQPSSGSTSSQTYGATLAARLLSSSESVNWMRNVKHVFDEWIEDQLQQLPQDLVILSLRYLVGQ
jgi:hypothetical protein